ncbi:MAG: hypothetical protein KF773_16875, partial [Deltaproteobacteria bacterium]|nr:hypothetical protein [Deltaproteobacteria bacterium]
KRDLTEPKRAHWEDLARRAGERACARGFMAECSVTDPAGYRKLVVERCARGHLEACTSWTGDEKLDASRPERACTITGDSCRNLARRVHGLNVRDALEHGCQFRDPTACVELAIGYREHRFEEPVPGRRQALEDFICKAPGFEVRACDQARGLTPP